MDKKPLKPNIAGSAGAAVQKVAAQWGVRIESDHAAQLMAEAACAFYSDTVTVRHVAHREMWAEEGFRDYQRQRMRHDLLDAVTRQGFVPVTLPRETIRYMTGGILDPDGTHEVPESGDWQMVAVVLEVPIRRPPVDRAAAVKAGVLTG